MSDFSHRLEVRFRDCDAMGHTNNAVYLTYLEQARFAHWRSLWGFGHPPAPNRVEGQTAQAHLERVAEIGRSSFRYEYEIVDEQGRTVLTAKTVQVMYDYTANRPVAIPDSIRGLLGAPKRSAGGWLRPKPAAAVQRPLRRLTSRRNRS